MSKNHPHDNIYSILGKLEALTPKETIVESKAPGFKEYEQVQAKGSVLEGVSKVEQTLAEKYMGFKKTVSAIKKGGSAENPEAVAAAIGRKKYGKAAFQKAAAAGKKMGETEEVCNECGMPMEGCGCDHTNEGEVTKTKHGIKHTKTDFPGYPASDLEDDDEDSGKPRKGRPRKAVTKNPRRDPNAPKKGRGRPSKHADADKDSSKSPFSSKNKIGHDPFGRVHKDTHDKYKIDEKAVSKAQQKFMGMVHAAQKGEKAASPEVAKVAKGMTKKAAHDYAATKHKGLPQHVKESITESINFKRMMEEQHMTLEEMLECMSADIATFKESGVCSDRLRDMMEVYSHAKRQMEEAMYQKPSHPDPFHHVKPEPSRGIPGNLPPSQVPGKDALLKGKMDRPFFGTGKSMPEEASLEEELNELARLAGLSTEGNAFTGKLKSTPKGGSFELDGKEYTDTSSLDEEPNEGNAFGKAVADAKADGIQPGEEVTVGGKTYPVKEADAPVDDNEEELANAPKKKYFSMKGSTLNPGEADSGEKQMNPDRPTFKNGDNALSRPPVREATTLEAKLAAEYESIKKVS